MCFTKIHLGFFQSSAYFENLYFLLNVECNEICAKEA